jgi:hypothetical protein
MATDPSWLYSTVAQSSAAIVAIIGGFITASVLNLLSEKRSFKKQLSEKETQTKNITEKRNMLQNLYDTKATEYFLKKELNGYSDDKLPTLDDIFSRYPTDYRNYYNEKILDIVFVNLSLKQIKATLFIIKHSDQIDMNNYTRFLDWTKKLVKTDEYIEISNEYDKYFKNRQKLESASKEKEMPSSWAALLPMNTLLSTEKVERDFEEEKHQSDQDTIYNDIKELDSHLSLTNNEIKNIKNQIDSFSYPPNLGLGVFILCFLSFFSIFTPIIIISEQSFYLWTRLLTITSFSVGIIGLLLFIAFQIHELGRK